MKYIIPFLCALLSVAHATKYYGILANEDMNGVTTEHTTTFSENDFEITSMFASDDLSKYDGTDYLTDAGIFNVTMKEFSSIFGNNPDESKLQSRAPTGDYGCTANGRIEDKIGEAGKNVVCAAMAGAAGKAGMSLSVVIQSKLCVEAGTGHPIESCRTIVSWVLETGAGMNGILVNNYCPDFLSFFVKQCSGKGANGTIRNGDVAVSAINTQKDQTCNSVTGKCVTESVPV